jgi:uncharacterized protein YdaU (DUF1376 family)
MAKDLFTPAWFPFYYGKFNSATQLFTAEAIGTYIIMLNYQWDNGGLPNDVDELCVLTKSSQRSVEKVLTKFDLMEDGLLWNERLEEIREEQHAKYLKSKEKADRANATIRMKKQILPVPSTERTTLHTTERSTSEQRNVNDTQIDVDVDNRLSNDNKEIDTNVSTKKRRASKGSNRYSWAEAPYSNFEYFEKEWLEVAPIITKEGEVATDRLDIGYYYNTALNYGTKNPEKKYVNWALEAAKWAAKNSYTGTPLVFKKIIKVQFEERYSDPQPVKPTEPIEFVIPNEFK